jgi:hypothetical protein
MVNTNCKKGPFIGQRTGLLHPRTCPFVALIQSGILAGDESVSPRSKKKLPVAERQEAPEF